MRKTKQKTAIENVFHCSERPLSIDEIIAKAQQEVPSINCATVYRNIKQLIEAGTVVKITAPHVGVLYEKNCSDHHHHFYCRKCEKAFDLPGCPVNVKMLPDGFKSESHELTFTGLCPDCYND